MGRAARCALLAAVLSLIQLHGGSAQQPMDDMAQEMMRWEPTAFLLFEKLEYVPDVGNRPLVFDVIGWWGGAYDRLWIRAEGEQVTSGSGGEVELELLYGRLISPFFDAFIGARVDRGWGGADGADGETRVLLSVGLEGLAPLWWELSPTLFVSQDGDISAQLEASYALLLTQRLVLEPRVELTASFHDVSEVGIAAGLNDLELGARMRYELHRKFAPYVGLSWLRRLGGTADLVRLLGQPAGEVSLVAGLRLWY